MTESKDKHLCEYVSSQNKAPTTVTSMSLACFYVCGNLYLIHVITTTRKLIAY
jgi:hypothetical protein